MTRVDPPRGGGLIAGVIEASVRNRFLVLVLTLTLLVFKSSPAWVHYSAMREQRKI